MTLPELVRRYMTMGQLVIMQRADTMFEKGRYYAGPLTDKQVEDLIEGLK